MRSARGRIECLLARAQKLQALDRTLAAALAPELASQVQVANLREGELTIVTPSAALATRLRMEAPQLVSRLREAGVALWTIEVRVAPPGLSQTPTRRKRPLSAEARHALESMGVKTGED